MPQTTHKVKMIFEMSKENQLLEIKKIFNGKGFYNKHIKDIEWDNDGYIVTYEI